MPRSATRLAVALLVAALSALATATACPPTAPTACAITTSGGVPIRYGTSISVKFSGAADFPAGQSLNYYVSSRHMAPLTSSWSAWSKETLSPTSWIFQSPAGTKLQWRARVQCGFLFWSGYYYTSTVIVQNTPPKPPTACTVSPLPADTTTVLTASALGATDVDGQTLSYDYHWYRQQTNGVFAQAFHGNPLPASYTTGNQLWMVVAFASDGTAQSATSFTSAQFTIGNAPPNAPTSLTIKPAPPQAGDTVRAEAKGATDPDNVGVITDPLTYEYQWYWKIPVGKPRLMGSTAALKSSAMKGGQQWFVKARAADSHGGKSPWRTLDFTVANTAPTAPTAVTITPAAPNEDQDLVGNATGQHDVDGNPLTLTYQWVRYQGELPILGPLGKTLPASTTASLQVWAVRARASDASATSGWRYSNKVTLADVNHPPPAPTSCVITTPAPITESDNLTTSVLADNDPDGDARSSEYQWAWKSPVSAWSDWQAGTGARPGTSVFPGFQYKFRARSVAAAQASAWTESALVTALSLISSTTPVDDATGIGRRSSLLVNFRKPVNEGTVASRFVLHLGGFDGTPVPGALTWPTAQTQLRFRPTVPMQAASHYTAILGGGFARADGILVASQHSFAYDTNNKPTVLSWSPAGSSVAPNASISLGFDRAMNFDTVKAGFTLTPTRTGIWTHSADLKTFTFQPATPFTNDRNYNGHLAETAKDAGGTAMGVPFDWGFHIRPATSPAPMSAALTAAAVGDRTQLTVSLSAPAQVQLTICNLAGRTVALLPLRALPAGLSTLLWSGRATSGSKVPPGAYLVRCRAVGEGGSTASVLAPLTVR